MKSIKKSILKEVYKPRPKDSHKGDFGKLLIIGGSKKYSGAPALNALAALSSLKTGTDLVETISPQRAATIIAKFSPDIITYPLKGDYIKKSHLKTILKESKNKSAFVIGGGLQTAPATKKTIRKFLQTTKLPGVIDADAIHIINKKLDLSNFIITPHSHEFELLTKQKPSDNKKERIKQVKQQAKKFNTTLLLKGNPDIISNGKQTAINKTGNQYMTVGGTGDTLAGIIGSLIAQGNKPFKAACAAAYINGKAAELTKKKISLTASDIIKKIPEVVG